ncbi:MAG: hypothetical protein J7K81_00260 [Methanophagales archaeon]|nr:hypothetical protein [Methanophagales archaeon]
MESKKELGGEMNAQGIKRKNKVHMVKYITVGLLVGLIVGVALSAFAGLEISAISKEEAGNKSLVYINENILKPQGLSAELTSIEDYSNDLYIVNIDIKDNNQTVKYASIYITKSGDFLIMGRMVNLTKEMESMGSQRINYSLR